MLFPKASLVVVAMTSALLSGTAAQAHASLVASIPAANGTVVKPTKLMLRFDERLARKGSSIELFMTAKPGAKLAGPANLKVVTGFGSDGKTLIAPLKQALTPGTYLVAWHATAGDGDRKDGTFSFKVR